MLSGLLSDSGFMPHVHCYLNRPALVWSMFVTDFLIGIAYMGISMILLLLTKKIKIPFNFIAFCFGVFILACGLTHFMEVYTLWNPTYWLAAVVKGFTAVASVGTGIYLYQLRHSIVSVAEEARLSERRRSLLEQANQELQVRSDELFRTNQMLAEQQKILAHSAKMSALGEMAGGIAHEINSPLGIIAIHANQLERFSKRGILTSEMIIQEAHLIASTAKRIGEIIKGLRAFAREGGDDPFFSVRVSNILQDALVLCQTRFKTNGIDLFIPPIPAKLEIECRSVQITQVILNLLNNAFDAVQSLSEKWVRLEMEETANDVVFHVLDSGDGISEDIIPKLFQPFFTTKEVGNGTGLGLSISKGIIDAHRGSLYYDPSDKKTHFVVRIPKRHISEKGDEIS